MKHYKFTPCTGPIEGIFGDSRHILYKGEARLMHYDESWFFGVFSPVTASDWPHIEVLKEVEGVVMTKEDVSKVWDAGYNRSYAVRPTIIGAVDGRKYPDKETTINKLFNP